eukprot:5509610-Amphidinium_carterae.1
MEARGVARRQGHETEANSEVNIPVMNSEVNTPVMNADDQPVESLRAVLRVREATREPSGTGSVTAPPGGPVSVGDSGASQSTKRKDTQELKPEDVNPSAESPEDRMNADDNPVENMENGESRENRMSDDQNSAMIPEGNLDAENTVLGRPEGQASALVRRRAEMDAAETAILEPRPSRQRTMPWPAPLGSNSMSSWQFGVDPVGD